MNDDGDSAGRKGEKEREFSTLGARARSSGLMPDDAGGIIINQRRRETPHVIRKVVFFLNPSRASSSSDCRLVIGSAFSSDTFACRRAVQFCFLVAGSDRWRIASCYPSAPSWLAAAQATQLIHLNRADGLSVAQSRSLSRDKRRRSRGAIHHRVPSSLFTSRVSFSSPSSRRLF